MAVIASTGKVLAMHVDLVESGTTSAFAVAEFFRKYVASRPGVAKSELLAWMTELLDWHGVPNEQASFFAQNILSALIALGDVGLGTAFGQAFVVPLSERHIILPDGRIVCLGGSADRQSSPLLPGGIVRCIQPLSNSGGSGLLDEIGPPDFMGVRSLEGQTYRYSDLAAARLGSGSLPHELQSWASFAVGRPTIAPQGQLRPDDGLPSQFRRAILLCGAFDISGQSYEIGQEAADLLNDWLGIPHRIASYDPSATSDDPDQKAVILAKPDARIVVEAGPGSGKTHVACERIAHLIREGVAPPRIWLLSFTKVAVEEIRRRVADVLSDPSAASSINVATFDSFAGRLNASFLGAKEDFDNSFDKNIRRSIALLKSEDMALSDFVGTLEHVVIDEVQDLVGNRCEMVDIFLRKLPTSCGVTILGDFAQAIYGWQDKYRGERTQSLSDKLLVQGSVAYSGVRLGTDHRTRNPTLAQLFKFAREVLRDEALEPTERYDQVRSLIEAAATARVSGPQDPRFQAGGRPLVLFRGRKALLATGHTLATQGRPLRIKLSNRTTAIEPWIGAVLAGVDGNSKIKRPDVAVLWQDIAPQNTDLTEGDIWRELAAIAGSQNATLGVADICKRLERDVPIHFLRHHAGTQGPLLSTIHGAKGQEADRVLLMLPGRPDSEESRQIDWNEEARILYVGATRARNALFLGSRRSGYMQHAQSTRLWRGRRADFSAEIGLPGDVVLVHPEMATRPDAVYLRNIAKRLLELGDMPTPAVALRNPDSGSYQIFAGPGDSDQTVALGELSRDMISDLASIAGCTEGQLPHILQGFSIMGGTTVVWRCESDGQKRFGIGVLPILTGFGQVLIGGNA
jgi:DNA helicase-2/ATP-dependent DNA helicase PcrA